MILSDRDIKKVIKSGELTFLPKLKADQIGPASIDLKLNPEFKVFKTNQQSLLDPRKGLPDKFMQTITMKHGEKFILHPKDFILASTDEYLKVPNDLVLRVEGKSTLARMGILVHTAGFVDPGFEGTLTLEISNQSNLAVALYPYMYICQIAVEYLSSPAEIPYNKRKKSLYSKSAGPVEAKTKNLF
ncbi:MAG: dCTP deaminase [Patescibacteria group bacterium]|jgi:dCTP deaminase|nr:dCTP deaminase [Patescibacteria group bacterium]